MNQLLELAKALHFLLESGIEFTADSFEELTERHYEAYRRKEGIPAGRLYRVVHYEPTVIERKTEKVTVELSIVTESERLALLQAVQLVYAQTQHLNAGQPTFDDRLAVLRSRVPPLKKQ